VGYFDDVAQVVAGGAELDDGVGGFDPEKSSSPGVETSQSAIA